jgi:hypothetical protein
MQYLKYFFGGKVMGCFGGGKSCDSGFGCEWLIILAILFFCFCNGSSGFLSDLFDDCSLVWIAIILLLLFVCNNKDECDD